MIVESRLEADILLATLTRYTGPAGLDTETTGCNPKKQSPVENAELWCMTVAWGEPSKAPPSSFCTAFVPRKYVEMFTPWLESAEYRKVGSGIMRYDRHVFGNLGILLRGIEGDTERMSRLKNPSKGVKHGLKPLGEELGYTVVDFAEVAGRRCAGKVQAYKKDREVWQCVECGKRDSLKKSTNSSRQDGSSCAVDDRGRPTCSKCTGTTRFTVLSEGAEFQNLNTGTELVPLPTLWQQYPQRREKIVKYAVQDACMSLDVWYRKRQELSEVVW